MKLPETSLQSVRAYEQQTGEKIHIMVLRDSRFAIPKSLTGYDELVLCDFSKPHKIAGALLPYQNELLAITCRGEAHIARFKAVIPHVPYLRTPSTESLSWAADKYEMRKRLKSYDAKNTPVFTRVKNTTKKEVTRVIDKVGFPMIVKPANLVASLFVQICYHEEELQQVLNKTFRKLNQAYKKDRRLEEPTVMAEEYMDGDMYSIDSYVNSRGVVYHCPLVRVITGRDIGHDDFYNYKQITPTALKKESTLKAQALAETAIRALGLRNTTTHTELMKVDDEWKVIEIGSRMGGARDVLHKLSCDIDHPLNDILIRIPKKPVITKKCKGSAAFMKWFAAKEGVITEMKGLKKIEELESFHKIDISKKIGDRAVFSRNGGRSVFNLFLYNTDRSKLLADIRRVEKMVDIKVETRADKIAAKKATKANAKKKPIKKSAKKVIKKKTVKRKTTKKT